MAINNNLVKIEKRVPGTLVLEFHDFQNYQNKLRIAIEHNQEFRLVPLNLVLGMFLIPTTLAAYRNGMFTMPQADKEKVFAAAAEQGLYLGTDGDKAPEKQPAVMYSELEIRDALKTSKIKVVNDIIAKGNKAQKQYLVTIAREEVGNLKQKTIEIIEGGLGISLQEGVE
jgi:hypothetical protein